MAPLTEEAGEHGEALGVHGGGGLDSPVHRGRGRGAATARITPVAGKGTLHCAAIKGGVTFTPSLADGTTSQTKAKVAFVASDCHGSPEASGDGLNVMSAKITGTLTIRNQDGFCFEGADPRLPDSYGAITIKYKVAKGTQPLLPSELALGYFSGHFIRPNAAVRVSFASMSNNGSFNYQGINDNAYLRITASTLCQKSWKAVSTLSYFDSGNT